MAHSDHPTPRGFNPPFERTEWMWIAGAAIVAMALTYWATSGNSQRRVTAENIQTVTEPYLMPPITQLPPAPAQPAHPDEL
jgi:hypothetical protein